MAIQHGTEPPGVADYISSQPEQVRQTLEMIRQTVMKSAPAAEEIFSYGMPAFRYHGILLYYAAFTNHCSIFVNPAVLLYFRDRLKGCKFTKSGIKFPADKPLPEEMMVEIVQYAVQRNLERKQLKEEAKRRKKKPANPSGEDKL